MDDQSPAEPTPGERWVLRRRLPDGRASDVVGWVTGRTATSWLLDTGAEAVSVPAAAVLLARRAPAARGGPPPSRTTPAELEQLAVPTWAAVIEPLGAWRLRAAGGFTHRANACLAVGDPGVPLAEAASRVVDFAARHGIEPLVQVVVDSAEDEALAALGWPAEGAVVDVSAARLADLLGERTVPAAVVLEEALMPDWLAAFSRSRAVPAEPELLRTLLEGRGPTAFAARREGAGLVAIARGSLHADWLGVGAVWTDPEHRRRGHATALTLALGHWAARRGARWVFLQVVADHPAAAVTYAGLGFSRHHAYRYRRPPTRS